MSDPSAVEINPQLVLEHAKALAEAGTPLEGVSSGETVLPGLREPHHSVHVRFREFREGHGHFERRLGRTLTSSSSLLRTIVLDALEANRSTPFIHLSDLAE